MFHQSLIVLEDKAVSFEEFHTGRFELQNLIRNFFNF